MTQFLTSHNKRALYSPLQSILCMGWCFHGRYSLFELVCIMDHHRVRHYGTSCHNFQCTISGRLRTAITPIFNTWDGNCSLFLQCLTLVWTKCPWKWSLLVSFLVSTLAQCHHEHHIPILSHMTHTGYLVVWWVILLVLPNNVLCRQSPVWLKVITLLIHPQYRI